MDHVTAGHTAPRIREWLNRYIPAEVIGTLGAVLAAWPAYAHSHSYVAAAAAGWAGEGIGFYGYFVIAELSRNAGRYRDQPPLRRFSLAIAAAGTNLLVEFLPAELLDGFIIRPLCMYLAPQHIHPYALGFLTGKFGADMLFYVLAIAGYESRKRWLRR